MALTALKKNMTDYDVICNNIVNNNKEIKKEIEYIKVALQHYIESVGKDNKGVKDSIEKKFIIEAIKKNDYE